MFSRFTRLLLMTLLTVLPAAAQEPVFNREPLEPSRYAQLPLGAIQARGWLETTLRAQADGLSGHLDEVYPEVMGPDNAWLGGDGDAWERGPYWIDGLLPLAYILDDKALIAKAQSWVEAMLSSQREDGYFGPAEDHPFVYGLQRGKTHDWWPKMVALKVLQQHYMATGDARVLDCLSRYFRYQAEQLRQTPLDHWSDWGKWRGGDNLGVVLWLYDITGDPALLELAETIHSQTVGWTNLLYHGSYFYRQGSLHGVNLAQGYKEPIVWWQYSRVEKDRTAPKWAAESLRETAGLPTGLWAADELLHYGTPTRGSELCTVVEMMFSLEEMLRISGDPYYADWLERVAYNALPTQIKDDFSAKQYYQQVNQIACTREVRPLSTPHDGTDTMFGTLNGYPCCLSNFHQGWPKLTQNLWYATNDGGLAAMVYAPSQVTAKVQGGIEVSVSEQTNYPFTESVVFSIDFPKNIKKHFSAQFPLYFRVPQWCTQLTVTVGDQALDAVPVDGVIRLERDWHRGDRIRLRFGAEVETETWYDGAVSIVRGPLLYALPLAEKWNWVPFEGKDHWYGAGAWEVTTDTPWNYCMMRDGMLGADASASDAASFETPWNLEHAPCSVTVSARKLPHWKAYNGSVGEVAYFTEDTDDTDGADVRIRLIPYGCTTLRIAAFPSRIVPWDKELRETY